MPAKHTSAHALASKSAAGKDCGTASGRSYRWKRHDSLLRLSTRGLADVSVAGMDGKRVSGGSGGMQRGKRWDGPAPVCHLTLSAWRRS